MTRPVLLAAALLPACVNADVNRKDSGVAVGNPGEMTARVARGGDLETTDGWGFFGAVVLEDCDDGAQVVATDIGFDLTGEPTLLLPAGAWCGLTIDGGDLLLEAESDTRAVTIELELEDIELGADDGFSVASGGYVLQLGPDGWLSEEALDLDQAETLIDEEDDRAEDVLGWLAEESLLTEDADGDRERDDDEVVVAAGEGAEEQPPDGDDGDDEEEPPAGCGGGAAGLVLPLALLPLGGLRRRRRRADDPRHRGRPSPGMACSGVVGRGVGR